VCQAIEQALPGLTAFTGWQVCDRVLTAYPELRPTIVHGMIRNQTMLADALAKRAGQTRGSLYPELLAGAATSAFRAACSVWAPEPGPQACTRSSAKHLTGSPPAARLPGRLATARSRQSEDAWFAHLGNPVRGCPSATRVMGTDHPLIGAPQSRHAGRPGFAP
jgi:hypothetical protein